MAHDTTIRDEAIAWAVRTGDSGFDDWDGFTRWLEADPAHAGAYDEIMLSVGDAADALPAIPLAGNDDRPAAAPRRRWFGGAIAAVLAVTVGIGVWQTRGGTYAVETAPGEMRLVELDGGGQLALAGDTRVVLDRSDPDIATVERGQALFTLRHDSSRPFEVAVGEDRLVDIGTVFEVERVGGGMSVAVSEGAVMYNPGKQNVRVSPGEMLSREPGSQAYRVAPIALNQVGEWREGRLTFQNAALADVAGDLSRATGVAFTVAAGADEAVSGSLLIEPVRADPRKLGPLLGVTVRHDGQAWEIGAR